MMEKILTGIVNSFARSLAFVVTLFLMDYSLFVLDSSIKYHRREPNKSLSLACSLCHYPT